MSFQQNQKNKEEIKTNNNGWLYALGGLAVGVIGAIVGKSAIDNLKNQQEIENGQSNTEGQTSQPDQLYESLCCPITGEMIIDAAQLNTCGHTFERRAIEQWLEKSEECPQCRRAAKKSNLIKNYSLQQILDYKRQQ